MLQILKEAFSQDIAPNFEESFNEIQGPKVCIFCSIFSQSLFPNTNKNTQTNKN
jgi:hypothetical protein